MTGKEAVKIIKMVLEECLEEHNEDEIAVCYVTPYDADALDMAIKALEQEPCDDAVSRQAVLNTLNKDSVLDEDRAVETYKELLIDCYKDLPSVAPSHKKGKWVKVTNGRGGHECNICHAYAPSYQNGDEYLSEFCPNCGAKMEE